MEAFHSQPPCQTDHYGDLTLSSGHRKNVFKMMDPWLFPRTWKYVMKFTEESALHFFTDSGEIGTHEGRVCTSCLTPLVLSVPSFLSWTVPLWRGPTTTSSECLTETRGGMLHWKPQERTANPEPAWSPGKYVQGVRERKTRLAWTVWTSIRRSFTQPGTPWRALLL